MSTKRGLGGFGRGLLATISPLLVAAALAPACAGSEDHPPPAMTEVMAAGGSSAGRGDTGGKTQTGGLGGAAEAGVDASPPDASPKESGPPADAKPDGNIPGTGPNCGTTLFCRGHGTCVGGIDGGDAHCACDPGYVLSANADGGFYDCIVDKTCVKLKHLERNACRVLVNGAPAVALFFAADYCSGTPVPPSELGDVAKAFHITEDGNELTAENSTIVLKRSVQSFVTFAIDVSKTITENASVVSNLVAQLRSVVTTLKPAPGEAPTAISILIFGRLVVEWQPFTTDLSLVDSRLAAIESNPKAAGDQVDVAGTSLNEAFVKAIRNTARMSILRDAVTEGGVLTTGTVVVVGDGEDNSGFPLDQNLINGTLVHLISIGISSDIHSSTLATIGRDGSFLAPKPEDWTAAFKEIAERVRDYPKSSYLLGYCSTRTTGTHSVQIDLAARKATTTAGCTFDAGVFGSSADAVCNPQFFEDECGGIDGGAAKQCGGLTACGACPDDQCCSGGTCHAPGGVAGDCHNQDELCEQAPSTKPLSDGGAVLGHKVCVPIPNTTPEAYGCTDPALPSQPCTATSECNLGFDYCLRNPANPSSNGVCTPVSLKVGDNCLPSVSFPTYHPADQCESLSCAQIKGQSASEPFVCTPPARAYDRCAGPTASAVCETGTACQGDICTPRHAIGCATHLDCASGYCLNNLCVPTGACYFKWSDKLQ